MEGRENRSGEMTTAREHAGRALDGAHPSTRQPRGGAIEKGSMTMRRFLIAAAMTAGFVTAGNAQMPPITRFCPYGHVRRPRLRRMQIR